MSIIVTLQINLSAINIELRDLKEARLRPSLSAPQITP